MIGGGDIGRFLFRSPFVPFEFCLVGGMTVQVPGPEHYVINENFESFTVYDLEGRETLFYRDSIVALRTLRAVEPEDGAGR